MYGLTELYTGITPPRLANLITYSWCCHEFPGAFAEFGVMQGGSVDLLSRVNPNREIYAIDSFEGLPIPSKEDTHTAGEFALSDAEFKTLTDYFEDSNVKICKGFSPEVFKQIPERIFSFVHVDTDMYNSVKDALDYFYPRLFIDGGMMIFDDYKFDSTPGVKAALDEFNLPCKFRGEIKLADGRFCGQYLIVR